MTRTAAYRARKQADGYAGLTHGTSTYDLGCRCDTCRTASRERGQRLRADAAANDYANQTHGAYNTYRMGCRCEDCREANRLYFKAYAEAAQANGFEGHEHGRAYTYRLGCRCAGCTIASSLRRAGVM